MTVVAVLAKAPLSGRTKTRLTAEVGPERALRAYKTVGEGVVSRVGRAFSVCVWYDPPGSEPVMREWLGPDVSLRPQPSGDLGHRLAHVFEVHFNHASSDVIAIGADAPGVTAAVIRSAVHALARADVVLGPTFDGGYYLIGLSEPHPELFDAVPWSTRDVLSVTLENCQKSDLQPAVLGWLRDLDTAADLAALGLDR